MPLLYSSHIAIDSNLAKKAYVHMVPISKTQMFDTEAYFAQLELASRLPETNESTVSCPTVTETSMVSTHSDGQDVDVTSNSSDRETTTMASAPTVDTLSGGPWQGETTQRITQGLLGSTQQYQLSTGMSKTWLRSKSIKKNIPTLACVKNIQWENRHSFTICLSKEKGSFSKT